MRDKNCNIVRDLLPLYIDDVLSIDSKNFVESHLESCSDCKKEYELMKEELIIPRETKDNGLQSIKKTLKNKKIKNILLSIILTAVIIISSIELIFHRNTLIKYDKNLIEIVNINNNIYSKFKGKNYYSVNAHTIEEAEINGKNQNIVILSYYESFAESTKRNLTNEKLTEEDRLFLLGEIDNNKYINENLEKNSDTVPRNKGIDKIYYLNKDMDTDIGFGEEREEKLNNILKNSTLIWEKEEV